VVHCSLGNDIHDGPIVFFNGFGGVGKIILYISILANMCSKGEIVLVRASLGITNLLLHGSQTRIHIVHDLKFLSSYMRPSLSHLKPCLTIASHNHSNMLMNV
jgi:hypothetical protein